MASTASSSSSTSTSTSLGGNNNNTNSIVVSNDKEYLLSKLTYWVIGQNAVNATKMAAKGGANLTYLVG